MQQRSLASLTVVLALCAVLLATGCPKKKTIPTETVPTTAPAPPPAPPPPKVVTDDSEGFKEPEPEARDLSGDQLAAQLRTVYFQYDRSDLSDETRATLKFNADILKRNPGPRITIEGHCDERGTIDYNLALGQRRADAVRSYLQTLGVDASRLTATSYGEERPVDPGHSESAWSKNRRAEFKGQ